MARLRRQFSAEDAVQDDLYSNIAGPRDRHVVKDAFSRHEGWRQSDGSSSPPAFPYDQFTKVKDADIDAIYAYLMSSVEPVRSVSLGNDFGFPFNIRATLAR
jgi:hypothetical protein